MAKKIFVLRLHTIISSIDSTLKFGNDNEIVIPMAVWRELKTYDKIREKRKIAKAIIRRLEALDISNELFGEGVIQENGSILRVAPEIMRISKDISGIFYNAPMYDKEVLQTCLNLEKENPDVQVILISKSADFRTEARFLGIDAQDFEADLFPKVQNQYSGRYQIYVSKEDMNFFYENGYLPIDKVYEADKMVWVQNMFLEIKDYETYSSAIGRFDGKKIVKLYYANSHPYGITAKTVGQKFFFECLMSSWEEAPIVIAKGIAGTGKTFCALAYALHCYENGMVDNIIYGKPIVTVGHEQLGFFPGELNEKYLPHLAGLREDILTELANLKGIKDDEINKFRVKGDYFIENGIVQLQTIGLIRSRSIKNSIIIIDEVQNVNPGDIKTIVTRPGEGTKFIFLGDPTQVDEYGLDERYNGLVYLSEKFKGQSLCWQMSFSEKENVRSPLSDLASKIL